MNIQARHGSEGPKHDPYSYEEVCVTTTDKQTVIIIHSGLDRWLKVNGVKVAGYGITEYRGMKPDDAVNEAINWILLAKIGLTEKQLERAYYKMQTAKERRMWLAHAGHDVGWTDGYPGEHFLYCKTCGQVLDSHFNPSEVE